MVILKTHKVHEGLCIIVSYKTRLISFFIIFLKAILSIYQLRYVYFAM